MRLQFNDFPARFKSRTESISWLEIVHATATTGKGVEPFGSSAIYSVDEVEWKLGAMQAALVAGPVDWERRDVVDFLDATEKAALGYATSSAQTGLIARRAFGATHVVHLGRLDPHQYRRADGGGRTLPDFLALNLIDRKLFVIETKGSMGRVSSRATTHAAEQLDTRISVAGYRNTARYVHVGEFSGRAWQARLIYHSGALPALQTTAGVVLTYYYRSIVAMLRVAKETTVGADGSLSGVIGGYRMTLPGNLMDAIESAVDVVRELEVRTKKALPSSRSSIDAEPLDQLESLAREGALSWDPVSRGFVGPDGLRVLDARA